MRRWTNSYPGAIQRFGALIAVREVNNTNEESVVSENSQSVTRFEPEELFQLRCFTDIISAPDKEELTIRSRALYADTSRTIPNVFTVLLKFRTRVPIRLFCAMHLNTKSNLIICDFEVDQNILNSGYPADSSLPQDPVQIIHNEATDSERLLSTTCRSKPIHSLEIARVSSRQLTLMDLFQILSEIQVQLASSTSLSHLGDNIVGLVHDLTGFHRVMVYQFDDTKTGMRPRRLQRATTKGIYPRLTAVWPTISSSHDTFIQWIANARIQVLSWASWSTLAPPATYIEVSTSRHLIYQSKLASSTWSIKCEFSMIGSKTLLDSFAEYMTTQSYPSTSNIPVGTIE